MTLPAQTPIIPGTAPIPATNPTSGFTKSSIGQALNGITGMSLLPSLSGGGTDDGYWRVTLAWNYSFNGTNYTWISFGTNFYILFGGNSTAYSGLSNTNPPYPKIFLSAADRGGQRGYVLTSGSAPNRTFRFRLEGSQGTSGVAGSPTMLYEAVFYENNQTILDIFTGATQWSTSGLYGVASATAGLPTSPAWTAFAQNTGSRISQYVVPGSPAIPGTSPIPATTPTISMSQVNTEFGRATNTNFSLNDTNVRDLFGKPGNATTIALSDGWGDTYYGTASYALWGAGPYGAPAQFYGLNYSNEAVFEPGNTLVQARQDHQGVSSTTKGYFGGGIIPGNAGQNQIDGVLFSNLSQYDVTASLTYTTSQTGSVWNAPKGYWVGVLNTGNQYMGMPYATEAVASVTAAMVQGRTEVACIHSTTGGYMAGGFPNLTQIDGITFATETSTDPAAALVQGRFGADGVQNQTRGFVGGGATSYSGPFLTQIDGLQFSTMTAYDPAAAVVQARWALCGAESNAKGFWAGGYNPAVTQIDGITFSTEAAHDPAAALGAARVGMASAQKY